MRIYSILINVFLSVALLSCSKNKLILKEEEVQNDIIYRENSLIPYNGTIVLENKSGKQINQKQNIADGKLNGESVVYYSDGRLKMRGHYKEGRFEGLWEKWYSSGSRECSANYLKGQLEGECINWYDNGKVMEKGSYKKDVKIGNWTKYNENGFVIQESMH